MLRTTNYTHMPAVHRCNHESKITTTEHPVRRVHIQNCVLALSCIIYTCFNHSYILVCNQYTLHTKHCQGTPYRPRPTFQTHSSDKFSNTFTDFSNTLKCHTISCTPTYSHKHTQTCSDARTCAKMASRDWQSFWDTCKLCFRVSSFFSALRRRVSSATVACDL